MPNYFKNPDSLVDAVRAVLSGKPVEEKMDPVDPKALKGKHKDRKDKDIDNDGDVDSSDEYLHKRRQAISKAMKESHDEEDEDDEDEDDDNDECPKCGMKGDKHKEDCPMMKSESKDKKMNGKKDDIDVTPKMKDARAVHEMSDKQMKKREEIVKSMKKKMGDFKAKYGDRAKDVMYATATKMAMKEGFELTNEELAEITK